MWEDTRVWAHWNHSFGMYLSYLGPGSCVFTSWVSSGLTLGSGCSLITAGWQVFFPSCVFSGHTSSSSMVTAISGDWDILFLPIWQQILHFSKTQPSRTENSWEWVPWTGYEVNAGILGLGAQGNSGTGRQRNRPLHLGHQAWRVSGLWKGNNLLYSRVWVKDRKSVV